MLIQKAKLFCLIGSFILLGQSRAQENLPPNSVVNLQQCIDIAIRNNLQVLQSNLQMQSSGVYYKQAKDNLLPNISASANQAENFGRSLNPYSYTYTDEKFNSGSYGINAGITLFSGLQIQNSIRQNALSFDANRMDWQQQKDAITLNVILAYLQVLSSQDLLQISNAQASVDAKQVERLEIMNKDGAVTLLSTLYDLKGQYASDQVAVINNMNSLETAKINLFQLLNIPYRRDFSYERILMNLNAPEYGKSADSIFQTALATLPIVKSVDLKLMASQKALSVARGAFYPTLSLFGGLSTSFSSAATASKPTNLITDTSATSYVNVNNVNHPLISSVQNFTDSKISFSNQFSNNRYGIVGVQLYIPILNYLRARNNVKLAKINVQNAHYVAEATRNQLQQYVEQAYQNMIAAFGQYKSYQEQVDAYAESFRSAEIRFNDGVITSVDYVIAKNNIDRANTNLTQARYLYIFRTKILDYYQGRLTW